uniref:Uncharacterized protein n=1 Tax=Aureoumbra lagunensis TaxID=44058 RepID=A0A7S3K1C4_9STRA
MPGERKSKDGGRPSAPSDEFASARMTSVLLSPDKSGKKSMDGSSGGFDHVLPSKFYLQRQASTVDVMRRHEKFGYDPLDRALQEEKNRLERKKLGVMSSVFGEKKMSPQEEYEHNVKKLLRDHLTTMEQHGIVFHHEFVEERLGFAILVARYGTEGRKFIQVEETFPHCECYPEILKPTDELIEVNDKLILLPQHDDPKEHEVFEVLRKKIAESKRPLKLTFIHGERRDEAFLEQENRREMRGLDRPDAKKSALRGESEQCVRMATVALESLKNAAMNGDSESGTASKSKINEQVATCTHLASDADKRIADNRYAAQEKEVDGTKQITNTNLQKCIKIQKEADAILAQLLDKLKAEQLLIDEANRFAAAATQARESAENAAEEGHAQSLLSAVNDARNAETGVKKVEHEKLDQATAYPSTTTQIKAAVKKTTEERERAEAAQLKFLSAQAAKKCDLGGVASSEFHEEDAFDASKDIDDALERLSKLRDRLRNSQNPNPENVKVVDDAYASVKNDRDAAQAGIYAAQAKLARDQAEEFAKDNKANEAEEAAARAAVAESKIKDIRTRLDEEKNDPSRDAANHDDTKAKVDEATKSATSDRIVAEAAAAKAHAHTVLEKSEGQDNSAIDAALQRLADLLNRARTNPDATDEAKATVAGYAQQASGDKHLNESQQHAAAASKAREETQSALERSDFDEAKSAAERAGAAAVAAAAAKKAVDKDEHANNDTKLAVAGNTAKARDEAALAEASRHAAAAKMARKDADAAAEKGDAAGARSAAMRAAGAESEAAAVVAKTAASHKKDKLSEEDQEMAAKRLVELTALGAAANDDKNLAEAATAVAAAREARQRAEQAASRAATDPKAVETAGTAANEAAQAAAKATLVANRVQKDDGTSDSTKASVLIYASNAAAEAAKAKMSQYEAASVQARKQAEDAVIESDAAKAEKAALDAAGASNEAQTLLRQLEEDSANNDNTLADARAMARRILENQQQADAAKFAAAAAQARKNAQKAADQGDVTTAEDASNDAVEAELGVLELLSSVEADEAASNDHKAKIAQAAARTTEDRQLADAAKFAAMAAAGKRDAYEAAKRIDVDGAASAADSAAQGEEGLLELSALVQADSATSDITRDAIRTAAIKAGEDRSAADAAKLVAAARRARQEAEAAAKEGDANAAEAFANAAADAHAGVAEMVEQMSNDASKTLADELTVAEAQTRDEARLAEAAKFVAMANLAKAAAQEAASKGDMYKCAEAASDARTAEAGALALKKDTDADASAPEATKKGINAAAKKTTDARRIAEAAKCAAMSAAARSDAQKAAEEAPLAPNADAAMSLAEKAGEAEDTVEEALKQIQDILSNLRNDKSVSNETKVAIAKYAQPIIEDRHLAEAAKLAASATAARRAAEEAAENGAMQACAAARQAFHGLDHDATQLRELTDADPSLSAASKANVADAADHVAAERRAAEAAECAARAHAARKEAVDAANIRDVDAAEKAVSEARDADEIAQAILEEARAAGGPLVPLVEKHAKKAQEERILAEATLLAARSKRTSEFIEAVDIGKTEISKALGDMKEIEAIAMQRSPEVRDEVSAFKGAIDADYASVNDNVVPDKAVLASEVISKAAILTPGTRVAREKGRMRTE